MAPATTIGAAHPVALGGIGGNEDTKSDSTMTKKLENFAASYIQAIATNEVETLNGLNQRSAIARQLRRRRHAT